MNPFTLTFKTSAPDALYNNIKVKEHTWGVGIDTHGFVPLDVPEKMQNRHHQGCNEGSDHYSRALLTLWTKRDSRNQQAVPDSPKNET